MEFNIVNYLIVVYGIVFLYHVWKMIISERIIKYGSSLTTISSKFILFIIITLTSLAWPLFAIGHLNKKKED